MKKIFLIIMLFSQILHSNEVIVSEIRLECHEDGKPTQKWIGMLHLEPDNNWIKYTIITEGADKLGVEHWVAAERDTEMKIKNVKTSKDGQDISFEIVYPLNRGSLKFEGKKREQSSTVVYDLRGVGIIEFAVLKGVTNIKLTTNPAMEVAGKKVSWRFF